MRWNECCQTMVNGEVGTGACTRSNSASPHRGRALHCSSLQLHLQLHLQLNLKPSVLEPYNAHKVSRFMNQRWSSLPEGKAEVKLKLS